jgi:hypothetical protein
MADAEFTYGVIDYFDGRSLRSDYLSYPPDCVARRHCADCQHPVTGLARFGHARKAPLMRGAAGPSHLTFALPLVLLCGQCPAGAIAGTDRAIPV